MELEHKINWYQIVLPLGAMVAIFIFVGSGNNNVRTEASVNDPLYQSCKLGCRQQEESLVSACGANNNGPYPFGEDKCNVAREALRMCKMWYDSVNCALILSSNSVFSGFSIGGSFTSPESSNTFSANPVVAGFNSPASTTTPFYNTATNPISAPNYNLTTPNFASPTTATHSAEYCELNMPQVEDAVEAVMGNLYPYVTVYEFCNGSRWSPYLTIDQREACVVYNNINNRCGGGSGADYTNPTGYTTPSNSYNFSDYTSYANAMDPENIYSSSSVHGNSSFNSTSLGGCRVMNQYSCQNNSACVWMSNGTDENGNSLGGACMSRCPRGDSGCDVMNPLNRNAIPRCAWATTAGGPIACLAAGFGY